MRDIAVRPVVWTGVVFAAVVAGAVAIVMAVLHFSRAPIAFDDHPADAAPGLASAPQDDLAKYRREKQQRLDSVGWIDRNAGTAHIPIGDAMDLLVQRKAQGGAR